eukprot:SAG11_NODE_538_length_8664_cov_5.830590_3_plen_100_part_00
MQTHHLDVLNQKEVVRLSRARRKRPQVLLPYIEAARDGSALHKALLHPYLLDLDLRQRSSTSAAGIAANIWQVTSSLLKGGGCRSLFSCDRSGQQPNTG